MKYSEKEIDRTRLLISEMIQGKRTKQRTIDQLTVFIDNFCTLAGLGLARKWKRQLLLEL